MVRYYCSGRFSEPGSEEYDRTAAWFHLEIAANCSVLEAVVTVAKICLNLPHDLLHEFAFEVNKVSQISLYLSINIKICVRKWTKIMRTVDWI